MMVIIMKVNGKMIKQKDMVFIIIQMEENMKVNGKKINKMVMVLKIGLMEVNMKVII